MTWYTKYVVPTYLDLINELKAKKTIKTDSIFNAFKLIQRQHFIHPSHQHFVGIDRPISIGYGQTNSQPTTVAMMLEWLCPCEGHRILDIGSGSGWTSALLGCIVGKQGQVNGLEKIPELVEFGLDNLRAFSLENVSIQLASRHLGLPNQLFDRILVSAAAVEFPTSLLDQLKPGGILVIPIENDIIRIHKHLDGSLTKSVFKGFRFVPLR